MWLHRKKEHHAFFEKKEQEISRLYSRELTGAAVRAIQTEKLNAALAYVKERSVHYREVLADIKPQLALGDLAALPFTTKDDLKQHRQDLPSIPLEQCDLYCETTGTTGEAAPSPRHTLDRIWNNCNWVHGWRRILGQPGKIVGISGPTELHGMVDSFTDVYQSLGHCVAKIYPFSTKVNFVKALKTMQSLKIEVLHVTPTIALMMVKAARAHGFDLQRDFALKSIFLTGEMCSEAMARNVGSFWGARAMNNPYASQEALGLSVGLEDGKLYTMPLSYVYELIDENERPIGPEGRGELVVTMLEPGARPLVRFRTGDLVDLRAPAVDAPIDAPTIVPLGRTRDVVRVGDHSLTAYELEDCLLTSLARVLNYQFVIEPGARGSRVVAEVELEEGRALTARDQDAIRERFRTDLHVDLAIRRVKETDAASSMSALAGWKAARIKDLTTEPDVERKYAERAGAGRRV